MALRRITVCQDCLFLLRQPQATRRGQLIPLIAQQWSTRSYATTPSERRAIGPRRTPTQHIRRLASEKYINKTSTTGGLDLNAIHSRVQELSASVRRPEDHGLPPEQRVLYVLEQLTYLAHLVQGEKEGGLARQQPRESPPQQQTATSALLGSVNARRNSVSLTRAAVLDEISMQAEEIARDDNVFLTAGILKTYIELQSFLAQPASFPDIFDLYARKPIPHQARPGAPIDYTPASPDKISAAVDARTASTALTAALQTHSLALTLDVLTTTLATRAFKNSKLLRQLGLPAALATAFPLLAWTLASQFATIQTSMTPAYATGVAFAGTMAYAGAVGTMGYITITTANDQMERVVWAPGVPLWERWLREEERAAADRVAGKWGFAERERRGDEEGAEWEALREWIGARGMVLDKVGLMEGME